MSVPIVRVFPVPGRLILMPERAFQPVPADGARVYLDAFYTRAINQGDLVAKPDAPASAAEPVVATAAAPPAAPVFVPAQPVAAPIAPATK